MAVAGAGLFMLENKPPAGAAPDAGGGPAGVVERKLNDLVGAGVDAPVGVLEELPSPPNIPPLCGVFPNRPPAGVAGLFSLVAVVLEGFPKLKPPAEVVVEAAVLNSPPELGVVVELPKPKDGGLFSVDCAPPTLPMVKLAHTQYLGTLHLPNKPVFGAVDPNNEGAPVAAVLGVLPALDVAVLLLAPKSPPPNMLPPLLAILNSV